MSPNRSPRARIVVLLFIFSFSSHVLFASAYAPPVLYPAGNGPNSIAIADFNVDGNIDIAVSNALSNNVSILLGNGDGTFQPPVNYSVGSTPAGIAMNCRAFFVSGLPVDLLVTNAGDNTVSVLRGNGDGTFQPAVNYSLGTGTSPRGVVGFFDLNGDTFCDFAVANSSGGNGNAGNIAVFLGNGDGTYQVAVNYATLGTGPVSIGAGDFNGDNSVDLAVADFATNDVTLLLNNGSGGLTASSSIGVPGGPISITANSSQLIVADSSANTISFLAGVNGKPILEQNRRVGSLPVSSVVELLNPDNVLDVAVANEGDNTVSVFLGLHNNPFYRKVVSFSTCSSPQYIAAVDVNHDKKTDLILACSDGIGVMLNTGP
jgi:hypothetical protein